MEITVRLKLKGVELELTAEEARSLRDALDGIVGRDLVQVEKATKEYIPYPVPSWVPYPVPSWVPYPGRLYFPTIITCEAVGSGSAETRG